MGAWGTGIFDNDTACDYVADVAKASDLSLLKSTLARAEAAGANYLEAPDAEEALAAADIVARLAGRPGAKNMYTAKVDEWVDRAKLAPDKALMESARRSVERVLKAPSELLEVWRDSGEYEAWKSSVKQLLERL